MLVVAAICFRHRMLLRLLLITSVTLLNLGFGVFLCFVCFGIFLLWSCVVVLTCFITQRLCNVVLFCSYLKLFKGLFPNSAFFLCIYIAEFSEVESEFHAKVPAVFCRDVCR